MEKLPRTVQLQYRRKTRNARLESRREDGSYSARLREAGSGASLRGTVRKLQNGEYRFVASNSALADLMNLSVAH